MPEPLKNIYTTAFFNQFSKAAKQVLPQFDQKKFLAQVIDEDWETKELKQRMRHIASVLKEHLPGNYKKEIAFIISIINQLKRTNVKPGFEYLFLPDFIEQYGLDDLKTSLAAIETITQFISCEFAIRPLLIKYPGEVMKQMLVWSKHPDHHVRRFSSEGCRPRLPWAMAIPQLKKDPSTILPILENLKNDESLFVRKSVANNLNDIAKDHPAVVFQLVKSWKGASENTDWIIRHGCRTLLKKADENIYSLFQLNGNAKCKVHELKLDKGDLKIGDRLGFSFVLQATNKEPAKLRVEYAVYYIKANGKQSRKLFQITEKVFEANTSHNFKK
ncbi:MAG: DNA alkylation repair protein, partial [Bacteroidota bacterium]